MTRSILRIGALFALVSSSALTASDFRDCRDCPTMVSIPAGTFVMGTSPTDPLHDTLEGPVRSVAIRRFAVGRLNVTRSEWTAFVRTTHRPIAKGCQWTGKQGPDADKVASWDDLGFDQSASDPVVCVSWNDARDYTNWLSRRTGKRYRLLSEAEWEYAARAGTKTPYYWGKGPSHDYANHGTEKCCGGAVTGRDVWIWTSPGGAFPANRFGLYDMSGNVLQWVEDCFSPTYAGLPVDGSAFTTARRIVANGDLAELDGTLTCSYRVVRGGDWGDQSRWVRTAARSFAPPPGPGPGIDAYRSGGVGFRVARDLDRIHH